MPELDDIEVEMSFLLQSASNAVIDIIPKDVLKVYLGIHSSLSRSSFSTKQ